MAVTRTRWLLGVIAIALGAGILLSAVLLWSRYTHNVAVEISLVEPEPVTGTIYIGNGVAMPGAFAFTAEDTIGGLLAAAGGLNSDASLDHLQLSITPLSETVQKVDVNRAEVWLLKALPGVGDVLARRIVDYRQTNGPFANTVDLTRVSGLGKDTYDKIKDLITVGGS